MDVAHQNKTHAFTGLFPGDHFIHEFDLGGQSFFAYGLLTRIDHGKYHANYQSSPPPCQPTLIEKESHRIVGRISRRAYELARLRGWPNSQDGVAAVIDYSTGKRIRLSFRERIKLFFIR